MYHEVTSGTPRNVHAVTAAQLRDQLQWLTDHGFRSAELGEIKTATDRCVALTFDDAYVDFLEVALPILQQFKFKATVFVISDLVGQRRHWADGDDESQPPLMDWAQIEACQQAGVQIGSHTATHPNLATLSETDVVRELSQSRQQLMARLGGEIDWLCYPYGRQNAMVQTVAQQVGYRLACASRPFYVGRSSAEYYALDRIAMLATDSLDDFAAKINPPLRRKLKWYRWLVRQSLLA